MAPVGQITLAPVVWWVGDPLVSQNTIMEMVAGEMGDPVTLGLVAHGWVGLVMGDPGDPNTQWRPW